MATPKTVIEELQEMYEKRIHMTTAECPSTAKVSEGEECLYTLAPAIRPLFILLVDLQEEFIEKESALATWRDIIHPDFEPTSEADPELLNENMQLTLDYAWIEGKRGRVHEKFWHYLDQKMVGIPRQNRIDLRAHWQIVSSKDSTKVDRFTLRRSIVSLGGTEM